MSLHDTVAAHAECAAASKGLEGRAAVMVTRPSQYYYAGVANQLSVCCYFVCKCVVLLFGVRLALHLGGPLRSAKSPCSLLPAQAYELSHPYRSNASNQRLTTTQPPPASVLGRPEPKCYLPSQSQRPPWLCLRKLSVAKGGGKIKKDQGRRPRTSSEAGVQLLLIGPVLLT